MFWYLVNNSVLVDQIKRFFCTHVEDIISNGVLRVRGTPTDGEYRVECRDGHDRRHYVTLGRHGPAVARVRQALLVLQERGEIATRMRMSPVRRRSYLQKVLTSLDLVPGSAAHCIR